MDNKRVAQELVKVARELVSEDGTIEPTKAFGKVVKRVFRGYPWKYDNKTNGWMLKGSAVVEKFLQKEGVDPNPMIEALGNRYEGYRVHIDWDDAYVIVLLD
jgi:hypothetical protein